MFGKKLETKMLEASRDSSVLGKVITWLAIGISLVVAGGRHVGLPDGTSEWLDRAVLYVGFLLLIAAYLWHEIKTIRARRYARIQQYTHSIMHTLRDQHSILDAIDEGKATFEANEYLLRTNIQKVLDSFSNSFSLLTGVRCRSCIKLIFFESKQYENQAFVSTYLRDQISSESQSKRDEERRDGALDPIDENTDFKTIFKGGQDVFFCNNLPVLRNYENTSDPDLKDKDLGFWSSGFNYIKPIKWNLPYTATMVWPIRKRTISDVDGTEFAIIGFLTVDTDSRRVFKERDDLYFGAAVADTLFPVLRRMQLMGETTDD